MASRGRLLLAVASALFIAANTFNALNKGGDAQDFFEGGQRLLHGRPLYEGSGPASGFIGPPFQAAFFAPLAALSELNDTAARLAWYALNLVLLVVGVVSWARTWEMSHGHPVPGWRTRRSVWFALLAILLPLQTNFEHQNMNALLLGVSGLAARALVSRHWRLAGALIGFATALKVFPALAIVYVAARRWWACAAMASGTAALLTVLSLAPYGGSSGSQGTNWLLVASGGWPTRPQNQSLLAAIDRVWPGDAGAAVHRSQDVPAEFAAFLVGAGLLLGLALLVTRGRIITQAQIAVEFSTVMLLSVLLSPVAWDHYWVLLFPAFLLMHGAQDPRLLGRWGTAVFWAAAILTTGLSRLTLGGEGWTVARQLSNGTIAALLLYAGLLGLRVRLARAERPATTTPTSDDPSGTPWSSGSS